LIGSSSNGSLHIRLKLEVIYDDEDEHEVVGSLNPSAFVGLHIFPPSINEKAGLQRFGFKKPLCEYYETYH
jgi:hypothetical protein